MKWLTVTSFCFHRINPRFPILLTHHQHERSQIDFSKFQIPQSFLVILVIHHLQKRHV